MNTAPCTRCGATVATAYRTDHDAHHALTDRLVDLVLDAVLVDDAPGHQLKHAIRDAAAAAGYDLD